MIFTLVDTGMGHATTSLLEVGQHCASVEIQIRFLRPVRCGVVDVRTGVLQRGGRIVHLESRVHDSEGALVATASGPSLSSVRNDRASRGGPSASRVLVIAAWRREWRRELISGRPRRGSVARPVPAGPR